MNELTFAIFIPMIGMIAILFVKKDQPEKARAIGLFVSILTFVMCTLVAAKCYGLPSTGADRYTLQVNQPWIATSTP